MAEEKNNGEDQEAEGGSGSKKTIIIIAVAVLLAIGISVGVTVFLLGGDSSEQPAEEAAPEIVEGPTTYYDLNPQFLVTFNVNGRQRYMQAYVSLSTKFPDSLGTMDHHMPLIRSKLLAAYGGANFEDLQTEAGKLALIEQTKVVLNEVLEAEGQQPIDKVFFTNFVLQ